MEIDQTTPSSSASTTARPSTLRNRRLSVSAVVVIALGIILVGGFALANFGSVPNHRAELVGAVQAAVIQAGNDGIVDFRKVATFEWDRMYMFGAYTPNSQVSAVLGFPWGSDDYARLVSENFALLIFAKDREVTGWVVLNDYQSTGPLVIFDYHLDGKLIPRDAAVFRSAIEAETTGAGYAIYDLTQVK